MVPILLALAREDGADVRDLLEKFGLRPGETPREIELRLDVARRVSDAREPVEHILN
jgi:hypothetical protein